MILLWQLKSMLTEDDKKNLRENRPVEFYVPIWQIFVVYILI